MPSSDIGLQEGSEDCETAEDPVELLVVLPELEPALELALELALEPALDPLLLVLVSLLPEEVVWLPGDVLDVFFVARLLFDDPATAAIITITSIIPTIHPPILLLLLFFLGDGDSCSIVML